MLLTADWAVPVSSPPLEQGAVLVARGAIAEVGPAAQLRARYPAEQVRAFPGCVLLPGFVNTHTHLDYSAFRGFTSPRGFSRWIFSLVRARRRLAEADLATSAMWGAYECLRSGVTSIADTSYGGSGVARAARAAGLRARVYLEVFGLDDAQVPLVLERLEAGLERAKGESESMPQAGGSLASAGPAVEWGLSPHAPYTVSQHLYGEVARLARRNGLRMATHVAESRAEVRLLARGWGALSLVYKAARLWTGRRWSPPAVSPLQYLAGSGALGPDMLAVHAVQLDEADIAVLAASGAAVAHCPRSNRQLRCGAAPVAELRSAGVTVGLGTDSLASNDSLDMLAEMRAALEESRGRAEQQGTAALLPSAVLQMATLDGARALGWGAVTGSLEKGKRADLAVVQLPAGEAVSGSPDDLAESLMTGRVLMTMVDGDVAYDGGAMPPEVGRELAAVRAKLGLAG